MIISQIIYFVNIYLKPNDEWVKYAKSDEDMGLIKSYGGVFWNNFFNK